MEFGWARGRGGEKERERALRMMPNRARESKLLTATAQHRLYEYVV